MDVEQMGIICSDDNSILVDGIRLPMMSIKFRELWSKTELGEVMPSSLWAL
jgi:hypothetical protein